MSLKRNAFALISLLLCISWHSQASAEALVIATSKSTPPYIIEETESGFQLDRVKAVFEKAGHSIRKIIFTSNKRAELLLTQKKIDAVINIPAKDNKLFYSEPVVHFQNVAITLLSSNIELQKLEDLSLYRVMAFQNAKKFLGERYSRTVHLSPAYDEAVNQIAQLERLYLKQVDIIVMEHRIFEYFNERYLKAGHQPSPVKYHYLFDRAPRVVGFHNKRLRDQFNTSLSKLLGSDAHPEANNTSLSAD